MATYIKQRYLFMATDPVHVGTGGYRLGRVDNSIVREPGTRVPKIPGASLHGAARSHAARLYEHPAAAGQDHSQVNNPDKDPVCYTFGYIKQKSGQSDEVMAYSGVVSIFDAHILLFPVCSMAGPVWVTTPERLQEAGFSLQQCGADKDGETDWCSPETWEMDEVFLTWERRERLNLGWLMVRAAGRVAVEAPAKWGTEERWQAVKNRLILLQESLFSHVVNSNLEVRTSVAIDPERGAAVEGALFTYEAIPRAAFLTSEVVLDDYREAWPLKGEQQKKTKCGNSLSGAPWTGPLDVVKAGFRLMEWLGVGGMGTRGFGRLAVVGDPLEYQLKHLLERRGGKEGCSGGKQETSS